VDLDNFGLKTLITGSGGE